MDRLDLLAAHEKLHELHAEPANKEEDQKACAGRREIADDRTLDYAERIAGAHLEGTARNDREKYLKDHHPHKGKDAQKALRFHPDAELLRLGYKLYERPPDKISENCDKNNREHRKQKLNALLSCKSSF